MGVYKSRVRVFIWCHCTVESVLAVAPLPLPNHYSSQSRVSKCFITNSSRTPNYIISSPSFSSILRKKFSSHPPPPTMHQPRRQKTTNKKKLRAATDREESIRRVCVCVGVSVCFTSPPPISCGAQPPIILVNSYDQINPKLTIFSEWRRTKKRVGKGRGYTF